jgi:GNAT superfamily N-acetyltransferase
MTAYSSYSQVILDDSLTITLETAQTAEDRHAAYKLRYEIFSEEYGDQRWANQSLKTYQDPYDIPQNPLIIARLNNEIIGTVRGVCRKHGIYLSDHPFAFDLLGKKLSISETSLHNRCMFITRAAVKAEFRRKSIFQVMFNKLESVAKENNTNILIADVEATKPRVQRLFEKFGFHIYQKSVSFENKNAINPTKWVGNFYYKGG